MWEDALGMGGGVGGRAVAGFWIYSEDAWPTEPEGNRNLGQSVLGARTWLRFVITSKTDSTYISLWERRVEWREGG